MVNMSRICIQIRLTLKVLVNIRCDFIYFAASLELLPLILLAVRLENKKCTFILSIDIPN